MAPLAKTFILFFALHSSLMMALDGLPTITLNNNPIALGSQEMTPFFFVELDTSKSLSLFPQIGATYRQDHGTCWAFSGYRLIQGALRHQKVLKDDEFLDLDEVIARVFHGMMLNRTDESLAENLVSELFDPLDGGQTLSVLNYLKNSLKVKPKLKVTKKSGKAIYFRSKFIADYLKTVETLKSERAQIEDLSVKSAEMLSYAAKVKELSIGLAEREIDTNPQGERRDISFEEYRGSTWRNIFSAGKWAEKTPLEKLYADDSAAFMDQFYFGNAGEASQWAIVRKRANHDIKEILDEALASNRLVGIGYFTEAQNAYEGRKLNYAMPQSPYRPAWSDEQRRGRHASVIFGRFVDENHKTWYRVSDTNLMREDKRAEDDHRTPRTRLISSENLYLLESLDELIGQNEKTTVQKVSERKIAISNKAKSSIFGNFGVGNNGVILLP